MTTLTNYGWEYYSSCKIHTKTGASWTVASSIPDMGCRFNLVGAVQCTLYGVWKSVCMEKKQRQVRCSSHGFARCIMVYRDRARATESTRYSKQSAYTRTETETLRGILPSWHRTLGMTIISHSVQETVLVGADYPSRTEDRQTGPGAYCYSQRG